VQLYLYRAHAETMNDLSQRFDLIGLNVQRHVLLDSTGLQSAMFFIDRLARLLNLFRDFFTLTYISLVHL